MKTDMNRDEAKKALASGKQLTHRYFEPNEYIFQKGKDIFHSDGTRQTIESFWNIKDGGHAWDMEWREYVSPVVLQSPEMIDDSYTYRGEFYFQRMTKDHRWYVTHKNFIIAHGQYRNDLTEWIDIAYPQVKQYERK
jgi:hypothetical protein